MTSKTDLANLTSTLAINHVGKHLRPTSSHDFYIGLSLAILSSVFIGSSFILKKKGLIKLSSQLSESKKSLRAAQGGHGYLKEWLWWSGFLTMGLGELCNFTAYGFVPATLVTPLGALSVLVSAILAAYFLDEQLNTIGKIGCALTAIGSTVMVIHAPKEGEINTLQELLYKLMDIEFVIYVIITIASLFVLIYTLAPKYGNTNVLVYILICAILGSYTVMCCKGISLGIKEIVSDKPTVPHVYTLVFWLVATCTIVVQINYLNKSLDVFNTAIVTTVYYVLFSLFVMIASALLFKELMNVTFQDFVGCMCGFSTIICALCLIHFFKSDEEIKHFNSFDLNKVIKPNDQADSNNNSDIENNSDIMFKQNNQPINDNGLFENLTKKQSSSPDSDAYEQRYNQTLKGSKHVTFDNLNIERNNRDTSFSFLSYLNDNYKSLESKYLNRFKNSPNFVNYNYNKLITNESNEELPHQTNQNSNVMRTNGQSTSLKKFRYFSPFDETDNEQKNSFLEVKSEHLQLDQSEEMAPLNV